MVRKRLNPYDNASRPVKGVKLQHVIDLGWVITYGMAEFGLPELEIRNVPGLFVDAACGILRSVAHYLKTPGVVVRVGETMALSPGMDIRFVRSEPIPGEEIHYLDERWEIIEIPQLCDCCQSR